MTAIFLSIFNPPRTERCLAFQQPVPEGGQAAQAAWSDAVALPNGHEPVARDHTRTGVEHVDGSSHGLTARDGRERKLGPDRPFADWKRENLALLRIMTTAEKFAEMAKMDGPYDENGHENLAGRWMELQLVPRGKVSGPLAQVCRLGERGYERLERFTVSEITDFGFDPEEPRSVGAAANSSKVVAARLSCRRQPKGVKAATTASWHDIVQLYSAVALTAIHSIVVHDVGHANFTTVLDSTGTPMLHFDCGWPIPYNWKTYPPTEPAGPYANIVVLSHWDSDHYSGFHR